MSRRLDVRELIAIGACASRTGALICSFGPNVNLTREFCRRHASEVWWSLAAQSLLSVPACAEYGRAEAAAWDDYKRCAATENASLQAAIQDAQVQYQSVHDAAWVEHQRADKAARAQYVSAGGDLHDRELDRAAGKRDYERACTDARAEYHRALAVAWDALCARTTPSWATHKRAMSAAQAARDRNLRRAARKLKRAIAMAFADAYIGDKGSAP